MASVARLDLVQTTELSVVIPVLGRVDDPLTLFRAYAKALASGGRTLEFIYVLDGDQPQALEALDSLARGGEPIRIVRFNRSFGEAACLREGVRHARGRNILFLPAYFQIEPEAVLPVVDALDEADVVAAFRDRQADGVFNRLRGWGFGQAARAAGSRYQDPGCVVRAARRQVFDEIAIHDEQQRFLPLMAELRGFRVAQVRVPQASTDAKRRQHNPGVYLDVLLDLLAVSFLLRFIQKPFRFFGTVGALSVLASLLLAAYLVWERQVSGVPLSDRPALVLDVLLMVLGIQIGAIGLIAEIVIFTRSDGQPHYHVDKVIEAKHVDG